MLYTHPRRDNLALLLSTFVPKQKYSWSSISFHSTLKVNEFPTGIPMKEVCLIIPNVTIIVCTFVLRLLPFPSLRGQSSAISPFSHSVSSPIFLFLFPLPTYIHERRNSFIVVSGKKNTYKPILPIRL